MINAFSGLRRVVLTAFFFALSVVLFACASEPEPVEITITANDQMMFSVAEFDVQAGQPVSITLENVGQMPKAAMGHNLVILTLGNTVEEFGLAAAGAADTDYIPPSEEENILVHTALLGPGESDTITFTAPTEPGDYPFLCSFPGHYALMRGIMHVQ